MRCNAWGGGTSGGRIHKLDYADEDERKREEDKRDRHAVEPLLGLYVLRVADRLARDQDEFPEPCLLGPNVRHERAEVFPGEIGCALIS